MATVGDIVARTLRLIRVNDATQNPAPEDFATCIVALNAMMARWEADGLSLGWIPVSLPSEPLPAPVEAEECITYQLCGRVADEYGKQVSAVVAAIAGQTYDSLLRDVKNASPIIQCSNAPRAESAVYRGYNMYTDTFR